MHMNEEQLMEIVGFVKVSDYRSKTLKFIGNGVKMPRASPDFINSLPIALPNTIEQQNIVDYLDSKTTEINNAISKYKECLCFRCNFML